MSTCLETPALQPHGRPAWLRAALVRLPIAVALFKLRIVALLLFAGFGGAFLAAGGWPGVGPLIALALTGGSAAAGASALNEYLEQGVDAGMRRTARRPLVIGAVRRAGWVAVAGPAMILVPVLAMLPLNPALSLWSLAGAAIYAGVYTLWLKPRTVLNIVVGGFAGTCAVFAGGAAAGNWAHPGVVTLGLLLFLWTPLHFWSLALVHREDYARVGLPMLPARTSPGRTALWVAIHSAATGLAAIVLGADLSLGWLYRLVVLAGSTHLLWHTARLVARPGSRPARVLFMASNLYLAVLLLVILVDSML